MANRSDMHAPNLGRVSKKIYEHATPEDEKKKPTYSLVSWEEPSPTKAQIRHYGTTHQAIDDCKSHHSCR